MRTLISYLLLPAEISRFERDYLERMTLVGLWFFYAHLPLMMIVAFLTKNDVFRAGVYTSVVLVGPTLARRSFQNPRHVTRAYAFTAMVLGGLLVHFGQGPMQIEMHFYFFVLIALLAVFADPLVIILAAATVAAHHVVLWAAAPSSVFNYDASVWAVVVHALFVVAESVAACFVARSFFDNVIGLERIVRRRTDELATRTEQMTLVLENVEQGLVIVNADGTLGAEQSSVLADLLGPIAPSDRLWDWVGRADAAAGTWIEVGWSMLVDDVVPIEVAIDQLPRRILSGDHVFQLSYRCLAAKAGFGGLLFVVTDVTSEAERERYESEQRELLVLFERVLKDRSGVLEFAAEANEIVEDATDDGATVTTVKRLLHTLKGNAAIFGCGSLARVCHDIESRVEETGGLLASDCIELRVSWDHVRHKLEMLIGDHHRKTFEVEPEAHEAVVRALREGGSRQHAVEVLEDWALESTEIRLNRLADQAHRLARRLGKGEINVHVAAHGVRISPDKLRPFWASLLHVLRNAADHGLEQPSERLAAGKSARGTIELSTRLTDKAFVIQVSDDGRGIAWDRVRERAIERGIPAGTEAELTAALFADGLSTRDVATESSGRGMGMSAIAAECRDLGGTIKVKSARGCGTTVMILLPRRVLGARAESSIIERFDLLQVSA